MSFEEDHIEEDRIEEDRIVNEEAKVKYQHYRLVDGNVLTICSSLKKNQEDKNKIIFSYTIFNKFDKIDQTYVRKQGNEIALARLNETPLEVLIPDESLINHPFISWAIIEKIKSDIPKGRKENSYNRIVPNETYQTIDILSRFLYIRLVDNINRMVIAEIENIQKVIWES